MVFRTLRELSPQGLSLLLCVIFADPNMDTEKEVKRMELLKRLMQGIAGVVRLAFIGGLAAGTFLREGVEKLMNDKNTT